MSVLLWFLLTTLFAPVSFIMMPLTVPVSIEPYQEIWRAVKSVEIGSLPDTTINHSEGAYGPGQIRQCKLDDYNKANGTAYTLRDCLYEPVARKIFYWHMDQYTDRELGVRRWNGSGPDTFDYLAKVKAEL